MTENKEIRFYQCAFWAALGVIIMQNFPMPFNITGALIFVYGFAGILTAWRTDKEIEKRKERDHDTLPR